MRVYKQTNITWAILGAPTCGVWIETARQVRIGLRLESKRIPSFRLHKLTLNKENVPSWTPCTTKPFCKPKLPEKLVSNLDTCIQLLCVKFITQSASKWKWQGIVNTIWNMQSLSVPVVSVGCETWCKSPSASLKRDRGSHWRSPNSTLQASMSLSVSGAKGLILIVPISVYSISIKRALQMISVKKTGSVNHLPNQNFWWGFDFKGKGLYVWIWTTPKNKTYHALP